MWKSVASNGLTLVLVALVALGGLIGWGQRSFTAEGPLQEPMCLRVPPGASISLVSDRLDEEGALSDSRIFRIGADYTEKSADLKFGSYLIPAGASMVEILDIVTRGGQSTCGTEVAYRIGVTQSEMQVRELDPNTGRYEEIAAFDPADVETPPAAYTEVRSERDTRYRVVVAEGVTSWQVADALTRADFLDGTLPEVPPEGRLAPDSYEVSLGGDTVELIDRMMTRQDDILAEAWSNRAENLPLETPEEALILASIVEKETGLPDERGTVAAVFVNRLNDGMLLQTDPTVIYGITEGIGVLGRGLRQSELRRRTDYNTYVIEGLPPGPIANPGRASIEAALNPADSDYIFFVADGSGGHAFARTLDEHRINVRKWREIEAERNAEQQNQQ